MSTSASAVAADTWQAGFLSILPKVQMHAQIQFRARPTAAREEAVTEAIAAACVSYQILAAQGRLHEAFPSTLANYAIRHVHSGRHIGGRQDTARDVLSPAAARRHGVRIVSYDRPRAVRAVRSGGGRDGWQKLVIEDRRASIPDLAAFRIDFADWLRSWPRRERKIIARMIAGDGTAEVAGRFGISPGRVSQLRRRFEQSWGQYQGESTFN
jgi:hypothetical protein